MPTSVPKDSGLGVCKQCQVHDAVENVRSRPMCKDCFCKYIATKAVKRMEKFRTRFSTAGQQRVLLLPLSMGVSSLALLHCLDEQLKRQIENTGRTGFALQILHVDMTAVTAKGRGFALAWLVSDGPSPYGIDFYYPMRDLLKKEIHAYATYTNPPLSPLVAPEPPLETVVSAKHSTIDGLMRNYFDAVEKNYPSIVANVVRTTAKLQAPGVGAGDASCSLCGLPLLLTPRTEEGLVAEGKAPPPLCYGCMRSVPMFSP
ncbi:unnamed protein product [Aureobasidium pullulans]|nr:unnamed protein product [Aureobasidium pullulans]